MTGQALTAAEAFAPRGAGGIVMHMCGAVLSSTLTGRREFAGLAQVELDGGVGEWDSCVDLRHFQIGAGDKRRGDPMLAAAREHRAAMQSASSMPNAEGPLSSAHAVLQTFSHRDERAIL